MPLDQQANHSCTLFKVVLWRKSHPSYWSHFKTETKSLYEEKKCCLLFTNISIRFRDIQVFKTCKLAKWWRHILNQIAIKYDEKKTRQFVIEMFEFCSMVLLRVQHNMSWNVLLPWQHNGFQTSTILKEFLATFSVLFSYLQMVPRMYDPAGI